VPTVVEESDIECRGARIVLADDHAIVRSALRVLLEEVGFEIVAEAGDLNETRRKVRAYKPDVLLLDLSMPDGSSLAEIPALREASPGTAIVVLTMQHEPGFAHEALRAGASAFVLKEAADTELVGAVRGAIHGHPYLDPELGALMALEPENTAPRPDDLSDRELQVLKLLALGYTNVEIAAKLVISIRTVEAHRSHLQHKLRRGSRAELVEYAREHELFP
jgi:two-component system, NarL family, response regulator NreC